VVKEYLKAQANFDANGMWNDISDSLKQQLASSNTSVDQLQSELDSAKQSGRRYTSATHFGGTQIDSGSYAHFYVLTVDSPAAQSASRISTSSARTAKSIASSERTRATPRFWSPPAAS